jgi:MOSC domain-containing protein YiiM
MSRPSCHILSIFIGGTKTLVDARVIEPGMMQAGDQVTLVSQPNPGLTVRDLNDCWYQNFDAEFAERLIAAEGLMDWWKDRLCAKAAHPL